MRKTDLIRTIKVVRENHREWANEQERRRKAGRPRVRHVGCETHHRNLIKVYDTVLEVLNNA